MKPIFKVALASLVLTLMSLAPASAYAHEHSPTYRDHTPRVHVHNSHPRH